MYTTVIFDFDYTLGNSERGIIVSINYALSRLGYSDESDEKIKKTIGLSLEEAFPILTGCSDRQQIQRFVSHFKEKADEIMVESTELYTDTKEILRKLREKNIKVGIVTTKFRYRIESILKKFDATPLVDLIIGGDDVKEPKPNPEGLLLAVEHISAGKKNVLYVGDSIVDAKCAENAAVDFAGVLTGTTTKDDFSLYKSVYIGDDLSGIYRHIFG